MQQYAKNAIAALWFHTILTFAPQGKLKLTLFPSFPVLSLPPKNYTSSLVFGWFDFKLDIPCFYLYFLAIWS